jgi:hypothetical protein
MTAHKRIGAVLNSIFTAPQAVGPHLIITTKQSKEHVGRVGSGYRHVLCAHADDTQYFSGR